MAGTLLGIFTNDREETSETWQVGVDRLPIWVHPPEGRPFRPWRATCFSPDRDDVRYKYRTEREDTIRSVVTAALSLAARDWRCRPARAQLMDPDLVPVLTELLAGTDCAVEVCEDLPGLRAEQASYISAVRSPIPGILSGEGVTIAQVTAFAQAAADFHAAAPWRLLGDEDFLRIETSDQVEPALRHAVFERWRGTASLALYRDETAREAFHRGDREAECWYLSLHPLWELPIADADLWQRQGLALSGEEELCPLPVRLPSPAARPDARQLAFFEGLLRALAATTESEADSGRWEKDVPTHLGPRHVVLSLPDLLALPAPGEPLRTLVQSVIEKRSQVLPGWLGIEQDDEDEEEEEGENEDEDWKDDHSRAGEPDAATGELLHAARVLGGRRAVLLARRALASSPDSSAAYLMLASLAAEPAQALELYRRAQELADRALPSLPLREDSEKDFLDERETAWDDALEAREGIANTLYDLGRREAAAECLNELMRLDSEGLFEAHERLACLLVELGRDDQAEALLADGGRENHSGWAYTHALLVFRREGDSTAARRALREAVHVNPLVPETLLPLADLDQPRNLPVDEDDDLDADTYVERGGNAWRRTPGALTWLAQRVEAPGIVGPGRPKGKGKARRSPRHRPLSKKKKKRRR